MIIFQNPGEIDLRCITTLGVNVKDSENPIGFFGTGLKYALAVLLREGNTVMISSGETRVEFSLKSDFIRGKSFDFIEMKETTGHSQDLASSKIQTLGFTTDLGKNWTCLHAFRELWSNCQDESGEVFSSRVFVKPKVGQTIISVMGDTFEAAYAARGQMILAEANKKLLFSCPAMEIWTGQSKQIFYRGIAALTLDEPSLFTYNLIESSPLTEDRTLSNLWGVRSAIGMTLAGLAPADIVIRTLESQGHFEHALDFDWASTSAHFYSCCDQVFKSSPMKMNVTARVWYNRRVTNEEIAARAIPTDELQKERIAEAVMLLRSAGYPVDPNTILVCPDLGAGVLAMAKNEKILLTPAVFAQDILAEVILEEYAHLAYSFKDETRTFQNWLFRQLIVQISKKPKLDDGMITF